ncbi:hypothetical protein [Marinococcus halotolerans]|uniref:hypothetical protein n=1 Tax=Marinococcus halotolerans TaxID=301092 RepID=UPI0004168C33|nr:hypothetical protein [Marinococcus halotolerans]
MSRILLGGCLLSFSFMAACGTGDNAESNAENAPDQEEQASSSSEEASASHEDTAEKENSEVSHHDDLPYEWKGEYRFQEGTTYTVTTSADDPEPITLGFIQKDENIEDVEHHAAHMMEAEDIDQVTDHKTFQAEHEYAYTLKESTSYTFTIDAGTYAVFLNQDPEEHQMSITNDQQETLEAQREASYDKGQRQEDSTDTEKEHTHDDGDTHTH